MSAIDKYTKDFATEYANNEAEIQGFAVGSTQWKSAFKKYCDEALKAIVPGRNPRGRHRSRTYAEYFSDILGSSGIAGQIAKHYKTQTGEGVPVDAIQNRIMSSVSSLVKLYENAMLGLKTTTKGTQQGLIEDSNMSDFQLPSKPKNMNDHEYALMTQQVVMNWMTRDLLTTIMLESIKPLFEYKHYDLESLMTRIMATVDEEGETANPDKILKKYMSGRKSFVAALRSAIKPRMAQIDYKKIFEV